MLIYLLLLISIILLSICFPCGLDSSVIITDVGICLVKESLYQELTIWMHPASFSGVAIFVAEAGPQPISIGWQIGAEVLGLELMNLVFSHRIPGSRILLLSQVGPSTSESVFDLPVYGSISPSKISAVYHNSEF